MDKNEKELLEIVRCAKDPTKSIIVAINVIKDFLQQPLSSKEQEGEIFPEQGGTTK